MLLRYNNQPINIVVDLPGSKSISNRLLILKEVLNLDVEINNLSSAKDTQDLHRLLIECGKTWDVGHAGTDMRFLTALLSTKPGEWIITGSDRMKERPIKELVSALRQLGADISYLEKDGFPPLKIVGKELEGGKLEINGSISSQFISALLLIAPSLKKGLELTITNEIVSWSYIQMTIDILEEFGVKVKHSDRSISVEYFDEHDHERSELTVESDWSSASYWYSIAALAPASDIVLKGLNERSSQGDSKLAEIYKSFGITSIFKDGNVLLKKDLSPISSFEYDFSDCPDIAQTVAVTCLALNIPCRLTGLSTLKHKETDRLTALKNELEKFGAIVEIGKDSLTINYKSSTIGFPPSTPNSQLSTISTYNDHRMALSFAPLALLGEINIEDPKVVEKSYPAFWKHLSKAGINSF